MKRFSKKFEQERDNNHIISYHSPPLSQLRSSTHLTSTSCTLMETTDDNHNDRDHSDPIDNPPHPSEEPEHQPLINQQPTENNNNNNNPNSSHNLDNPPINNNPPSSNFPLPDSSNVNHNNNNPTNVTAQKNSLQNNSLSSLPLQMLIYFHYHYAPFFFALNLALFTYKGNLLLLHFYYQFIL